MLDYPDLTVKRAADRPRSVLGLSHAPVAQLDRAAASEAVGQKFESSRAHHSPTFPLERKLNWLKPN